MSELTDFLLARIAEAKSTALQAGHGCGYLLHEHNAGWVEIELPDEHNARPSYEARFIRINSPKRVLALCEAHGRIVERFARLDATPEAESDATWDGGDYGVHQALFEVCIELASVHRDHPEFRAEWAGDAG